MTSLSIDALPEWVDAWAGAFSPAERRRLTRGLATGLRQRQAQRIARQQNPDGTPFAPRKPRLRDKAGQVRRRKTMFEGLRKARFLRAVSDANGVQIGFAGIAAKIAEISQFGQVALVAPNGPLARYPLRQLLGWSADDRALVLDRLRGSILP